MNKSPLYDIWDSLNANFGEYGEWLLPSDFGDVSAEYSSVRNEAGVIDFSNRGKLRLSGKDHLKFLQGMLTNDVLKLEDGKGLYAAILTVKGRMISDMRVYKHSDFVLLDLEQGFNRTVGDLLKKYRLSYKADITDETTALGLLSIQGPKSKEVLEKTFGTSIRLVDEYDFTSAMIEGYQITVIKVYRTGEEGYDLYINNKGLVMLAEALLKNEAKPLGQEVFEVLRIEALLPKFGTDMDETNIPIEAELWRALDFEKGCYVGQEVVARIKWRGHVNWHLRGIVLEGEQVPIPGTQIYSGEKKIGRVTSSTMSLALNKPIALGYVRREFKENGTPVMIQFDESNRVEALVSDMAFYER